MGDYDFFIHYFKMTHKLSNLTSEELEIRLGILLLNYLSNIDFSPGYGSHFSGFLFFFFVSCNLILYIGHSKYCMFKNLNFFLTECWAFFLEDN